LVLVAIPECFFGRFLLAFIGILTLVVLTANPSLR
jgi:hypothetical protein